jgi:hypothetical protein
VAAGGRRRAADATTDLRPLTVFDALAERFARQDFRGRAFITTMIEAADTGSAAHGSRPTTNATWSTTLIC